MRHRRMPARTLDGQDKNIRPGHGRLKNTIDLAFKLTVLCQIFCRAKKHRCVTIMTASMHAVGMFGCIG